MKVVITGASGFLGSYLLDEAQNHNCDLITVGRKMIEGTNHIAMDLAVAPLVTDMDPDVVIHAAGKAHVVPRTPEEAAQFHAVNVQGTQNLLEGLEGKQNLKQFVFISSVAVYGAEQGERIDESTTIAEDALTPYGKSKLDCERLISSWCEERGVNWYCYRLPLVIGDYPKGNLESMIKAIQKGYYFRIKGNTARKSMVWAHDVAVQCYRTGLPSGIYNLTDGVHPDIMAVERSIERLLGKKISLKLGKGVLKLMAGVGDLGQFVLRRSLPFSNERLQKLTSNLTFSDENARRRIGWKSHSCLDIISQLKY